MIVGQQALMRPARKAKVVVESHFARGVENIMVLVVVDPLFLGGTGAWRVPMC